MLVLGIFFARTATFAAAVVPTTGGVFGEPGCTAVFGEPGCSCTGPSGVSTIGPSGVLGAAVGSSGVLGAAAAVGPSRVLGAAAAVGPSGVLGAASGPSGGPSGAPGAAAAVGPSGAASGPSGVLGAGALGAAASGPRLGAKDTTSKKCGEEASRCPHCGGPCNGNTANGHQAPGRLGGVFRNHSGASPINATNVRGGFSEVIST